VGRHAKLRVLGLGGPGQGVVPRLPEGVELADTGVTPRHDHSLHPRHPQPQHLQPQHPQLCHWWRPTSPTHQPLLKKVNQA